METSVGATTVRELEADRDPDAAETVAVPGARLVARPALEMLAMAGEEEVQLATFVTSLLFPSVYVPVAVNCWLTPSVTETVVGVTARETSAGGVIVTSVLPLTELELAVIVAVPLDTLLANPTLDTATTAGAEVFQVTAPVMFWVDPSLKVPLALICILVPRAIDWFDGVTRMDCRTAGFTVKPVDAVMLPRVAVITVLPAFVPIARPPEDTDATPVVAELHATVVVRFWVVPSL
jgi:hypothetical protein